jgi:hypothetical protein
MEVLQKGVPFMSYKTFHEFPPKKLIIIKKKEQKIFNKNNK